MNHDLQETLSEIPPEYQEVFRQTIRQELAEGEHAQTDMAVLAYLRQRREAFERGGFIRPDGRPGMLALSPEALYEQALPQLARDSLGDAANPAARRRTLLKAGLFVGVALLFLLLAVRGRARRAAQAPTPAAGTPLAEVSGGETAAAAEPAPVPTLPAVSEAEDSLQTIGGLGGALTIGRPSAIELHYGRSEETRALAIDPSRPTPRGELRYSAAVMRSANPVAVWLFGTVLNYAIGVPEGLVRNLAPGDRLTLNTDTGAALHFRVAETGAAASYEAGRLLSQNRLGLTLFALPAAAADDVAYAFAQYDVRTEAGPALPAAMPGDPLPLGGSGNVLVTEALLSHAAGGDYRAVITGTARLAPGDALLLSLAAGRAQTAAATLAPAADGAWRAEFTLPADTAGQPLRAELRLLPGGGLAVVDLGEVPRLRQQLQVALVAAAWDGVGETAVLTATVHNPAAGAVYLAADFIYIAAQGGDAYAVAGQVAPRLPIFVNPGETLGLRIAFRPPSSSVQVQIGQDLWAVSGFPAAPGP